MQQSVHARIVLAWTLLGLRLEGGEKSDVRLREHKRVCDLEI